MKKIVTLCLMMVMSVAAFAQEKSPNTQKAHATVTKWEQKLKLTVDQRKKAKEIMLDKYDRHDKAVKQFQADKNEAAKKASLDQIKADTKAEMKEVLTAEQFADWEKYFNNQSAKK